MKILLVSQYFWPETFRVNDLAQELVLRGNEVTVLTGKPNYPQGAIYKGYSFWGYKKEYYKGIELIRVPLIPRGKGSGLRLALNYLSFVLFSCLYILFHKRKFDVSLTFAISPITQVYAALLHKKLFGSRAYLWVQDLWPESVSAAGKMNSGLVYRMLTKMVQSIYQKVDGICIQSEAFSQSILQKGDYKHKISYIPNWAEDLFTDDSLINKEHFKSLIPDGFVVMFAGNIGEAQDFDSILKAAIRTKEYKDIKWVIVGDGRKKEFVEQQVKELNLCDTVFLLGRYPLEDMPDLFIHADVMLVSLKDQNIFSLTIPSKIQSYMAFGKPIISMINGIGNEIIKEANCGFTANAGDFESLANNVKRLSRMDRNMLYEKGRAGKEYYQLSFAKKKIIDNLIEVFQSE
ncbi:glycosyltransferase family 4 protein [Bacteroides fragilis]|uniref:glycosyltransferase family 4 protein n=1 Tax=Bacteroides fragilis TaxID=817 RepID=UPI0032EEED68